MKWINPALSVAAIAISAYLGYITSQFLVITNKKTDDHDKKQSVVEIATLSERMKQIHFDIATMSTVAKKLEEKVNSLDKQISTVDERLKNSTTKILMAAGATKEQALQYWINPESSLPQNIQIK